MSRLEDLIQTLCPDGVEHRELAELADIGTGNSNRVDAIDDGKYPFFVRSKQVMRSNKYDFDEEAIVIPGEGGIGEIFHYIRGKYDLHQRAYRISFRDSRVNTRFAYYYMRSNFKKFITMKAVTATVISIRMPMIASFLLPIPPLPIQEEIVRMLDTFSSMVTELEAEQAARVRQYEHYRDELLSFDSKSKMIEKLLADFSLNSVEFKKLGEICNITTGKLNANAMKDNGKYPFFTCAKEVYRIDKYAFDTEALLVSGNGSQVGHIHYYKGKFNAYQRTYVLDRFNENISFISHVLRAFLKQRILEEVNVSGVPYIKLDTLTEFFIPVPPQPMQEEIVRLLDTFSNLVNDVKSGLPAEIALRRKQYEYYRDKLLTFQPLK